MSGLKFGIVIVAYHSYDRLAKYVRDELATLSDDFVAVIVNNSASSEESMALARHCGARMADPSENFTPADGERLFLLSFQENLGYAKGNNRGAEFLCRWFHVDYLLFSNDDIEIRDADILSRMQNAMRTDLDIKMIGPRVVGLDGRDQSPHLHPVSLYRQIGWNLFYYLRRSPVRPEKAQPPAGGYCYWVSGAFMMLDAPAFFACGKFDEATFLYNEEKILAERLKKINGKCYYLAEVSVLHYEGASTSKGDQQNKVQMDSLCHYYRNYRHHSLPAIGLFRLSAWGRRLMASLFKKQIHDE